MVDLFRNLKPNQIIELDFSSCWDGRRTRKLKVGRRSFSKKYKVESLSLKFLEVDACIRCPFVLRLRGDSVSLSHGDMACSLHGLICS
tara:strand:+ start:418 stop:681 length:264 start_codon:yes stop_codon:yes gene_type:complete